MEFEYINTDIKKQIAKNTQKNLEKYEFAAMCDMWFIIIPVYKILIDKICIYPSIESWDICTDKIVDMKHFHKKKHTPPVENRSTKTTQNIFADLGF